MKKVAFVCVHNSCRSQIAEALCKKYRNDLIPYSFGSVVSTVNKDAIRILKEVENIDISNYKSKLINDIPKCDIYISMGCNVSCPFIGREFDDNLNIEDPTGKDDLTFINFIKEIKDKILKIHNFDNKIY